MPYQCETCLVQAPEAGTCQLCAKPMKFTLLPPRGVEPEPVPDAPTQFQQRYGINPHATRNHEQDYIASPFWDGLGKMTLLVVGTIAGVGALLLYMLKGML